MSKTGGSCQGELKITLQSKLSVLWVLDPCPLLLWLLLWRVSALNRTEDLLSQWGQTHRRGKNTASPDIITSVVLGLFAASTGNSGTCTTPIKPATESSKQLLAEEVGVNSRSSFSWGNYPQPQKYNVELTIKWLRLDLRNNHAVDLWFKMGEQYPEVCAWGESLR